RIRRDSPARSLRADLHAQARRRRELGHGGRCGGRRGPPGIRKYREGEAVSMSSLAKRVIMPRNEPHSAEEVRPEELRLLEAMLFASAEPLDETALAARLPAGVDLPAALARLQEDYAVRGVNLVRIGGKWTFRTASDLSWLLSKETIETRKLSRAAIETLAIIAYHQPVTRTEVE